MLLILWRESSTLFASTLLLLFVISILVVPSNSQPNFEIPTNETTFTTANNDYHNPANWDNGLPRPGVRGIIAGKIITASQDIEADSLTLIFAILNVQGNLKLTGTLNITAAGSINLNGAGVATVGGLRLFNSGVNMSSSTQLNVTSGFYWLNDNYITSSVLRGGQINLQSTCQAVADGVSNDLSSRLYNYGTFSYQTSGNGLNIVAGEGYFANYGQFKVPSLPYNTKITQKNTPANTPVFENFGQLSFTGTNSDNSFALTVACSLGGENTVTEGAFLVNLDVSCLHNGTFRSEGKGQFQFLDGVHNFLPSSSSSQDTSFNFGSKVYASINSANFPARLKVDGNSQVEFFVPGRSCEIAISGGNVIFHNTTVITSLAASGTGTIEFQSTAAIRLASVTTTTGQMIFRSNAFIDYLTITQKPNIQIYAQLQIGSSFDWSSPALTFNGASSNASIILQSGCQSKWIPTGSWTVSIPIENYGSLEYKPSATANVVTFTALVNHKDATFSVVNSVNTYMSGAPESLFVNYGKVSIDMLLSDLIFGVRTIPFYNYGSVEVRRGTLRLESSGTLFAQGSISLYGTTITSVLPFNMFGGVILGVGTFDGTLVQTGGIIQAGYNNIGQLTVKGLNQTRSGKIQIDVTKTTSDTIQITGAATLQGVVEINKYLDYVPTPGDVFTGLIRASTLSFTGDVVADLPTTVASAGNQITVALRSGSVVTCSSCNTTNAYCLKNNTCSCKDGYSGPSCNQFNCNQLGGCQNGTCTGPNVCSCTNGFIESTCGIAKPATIPVNNALFCQSGCTDLNAYNYDSNALVDDGNCKVDHCEGNSAYTFSPCQGSSCTFPPNITDCGPEATCIEPGLCQSNAVEDVKKGSENHTLAIALGVAIPSAVIIAVIILLVLLFVRRRPNKRKSTFIELNEIEGVEVGPLLGGGAFSEVFKGSWKGTEIALKKLKDENDSKELVREAATLRNLSHPHIVQYLGVYVSPQGENYLVTEYLSAKSLDRLVSNLKNSLTLEDLLSFGLQAALGMNFLAHERVIHRDLALRNLLAAPKGNGETYKYTVKVADFGLSRKVENTIYQSADKRIPVKWSAPEVISHGTYSTQSDVWAFGVTLWELLNFGAIPYPGMNNQDCIKSVNEGYRLPKPKNCPDEVYSLMLSCWKMDPSDRPSFSEICDLLRKFTTYDYNESEGAISQDNSAIYLNAEHYANV